MSCNILPAKTNVMARQNMSAYGDKYSLFMGKYSMKAVLIVLLVRASKLALNALATLAVPINEKLID